MGLLLLGFLTLSFLFKILFSLTQELNMPWELKYCWARKTRIGDANRVNIVFDNEALLVFSVDKKEKKALVLLIPEDFYFKKETEVYRLGSFFELGEMRDGCGGRFLKKTLENFLAVPIDRYVKTEIRNSEFEIRNIGEAREIVSKIQSWRWFFSFLANFREVKKSFETDLSLLEIFKLWWRIRNLRSDRISLRNLREGMVTLDYQLLDGTKVKTVDIDLLYGEVSELFRDSQIEGEKLKVEVLNTTKKQGLGQKAGLLVTHLGADLAHVGNWPETFRKTQIWLVKKKDRDSYTVKRLAEVFRAEVFVKPEIEEVRGDVVILLGEDFK